MFCAMKASDVAGWKACAGKMVRIVGAPTVQIRQHPVAGGPGSHRRQSYLEFGGVQIVVASKDVPSCQGKRGVTGTLNRVDLGGAPGTKRSYRGWSITGATIT